ncbi:sphingosine-1-phosphate lyase 1 [Capsaspora owczarzaki ATCC 30864]|uniref:sphingosine-1-phosphate lyase 1 n=1 Tax=Capsaspora owczarzaki (strain ATCC 30864) TaxID=595528 RepID=UPI0003524C35|nr:sphingosine-1-phosphate lyase 1 [Capsaspora owczarzaki ATCC 30864]|eukprot:XP_004364537.2 sphingosine-1-phosphate lyase 1 [Capsaspora owczarzaki ATCC 30864]
MESARARFSYASTHASSWVSLARTAEHVIVAAVVVKVAHHVYSVGLKKSIGKLLVGLVRAVPGGSSTLDATLEQEVDSAAKLLTKAHRFDSLPTTGLSREVVLSKLADLKRADIDSHAGKSWAYVYSQPDNTFDDFLADASNLFMHENALNPMAFPALRKMENDIVRISATLLGGDARACGTMTSGGTESILMAVKAHRDRALKLRNVTEPNMVIPITAHPAFEKAGHYFGVQIRHAPVTNELEDPRVSVPAMAKLIDRNTIMLLGSAPQYPHGVIDDIPALGALALARNIPLHVDACVGGFILPFIRKFRPDLPRFDFSVPGVASMSADLHKYGFSSKGSSVVLYSSEEYRQYQFFTYSEWPGGLFISPSMCGSRGGGPIAAAWACLLSLGESGYVQSARLIMDTADKLSNGVRAIPGLRVIGKPDACLVSFLSTDPTVDILAVADVMEETGWRIERQRKPSSIHLSVMPQHAKIADKFISELAQAVNKVRANQQLAKAGSAAMYGMIAQIPDEKLIESFLVKFMARLYTPTRPAEGGASTSSSSN